jgi:hypothetical protein
LNEDQHVRPAPPDPDEQPGQNIEIPALRHQIAVLQRQLGDTRVRPAHHVVAQELVERSGVAVDHRPIVAVLQVVDLARRRCVGLGHRSSWSVSRSTVDRCRGILGQRNISAAEL